MFQFVSALRFGAALLAIYYATVSGSYTLGMSIFSITSLAQLAAEVPTGVLSDRLGRKPTMVLGAGLSVVFAVFYAIGNSYWFLAAGATVEGLARALFSGNGDALVYETLAEDGLESRYADSLGKVKACEDAGLALSAVLGGVIASVWSMQLAFEVTVLPVVLAFGVSLLLREPEVVRRESRRQALLWPALKAFVANPRLRLLTMGSALREGLGESSFQFRSLFFQTLWPLWALGVAQTGAFVVSTASFYLSGRVLDRLRRTSVLLFDVALGRGLNFVALLLPSLASPALMSATSVTYGASIVASNSLQQQEFGGDYRATMGSISSQIENVGMALGTVVLGVLADELGVEAALLAAQCLFLLALIPYGALARAENTHVPNT